MADYLEARGVDLKYAKAAGLAASGKKTVKAMGFYPVGDGILIPYFNPFTDKALELRRVRYLPPDDKERRYSQPKGSGVEAYFVPGGCVDWKRILSDPKAPLHITEGEIKAIAACKAGFTTIGLGGVNSYHGKSEELTPLLQKINWKERPVFICYDSDAATKLPVQTAEQALAQVLRARGAVVTIVRWPNMVPGGKTGIDDLLRIAGAPAFEAIRGAARPNSTAAASAPVIRCVADVEAREVDWLWDGWLPFGMLSGIEGNPSEGKTFIGLEIAAQGSKGLQPYPRTKCEPFNTLYMSYENSTAHTTKQRFAAMGGDDSRLFTLDGKRGPDGTVRPITLVDVESIEMAIKDTKARLVVIDPLQSYMGANVDSHKANETRPLLDGLAKIAERLNVCIVIIRHLAKGSGARAIHRGLGSIDIAGAMRSVLMIGSAPDDPQNRAIIHTKNNVGPLSGPLRFAIEKTGKSAKVVWKGKSDLTAADLDAPEQGRKNKTQIERAREYLRATLANGPKLVTELVEEGEFTERVLERAAAGMVDKRRPGGKHRPWEWALLGPRKFEGGRGEGR
jgi:hypothetical protein